MPPRYQRTEMRSEMRSRRHDRDSSPAQEVRAHARAVWRKVLRSPLRFSLDHTRLLSALSRPHRCRLTRRRFSASPSDHRSPTTSPSSAAVWEALGFVGLAIEVVHRRLEDLVRAAERGLGPTSPPHVVVALAAAFASPSNVSAVTAFAAASSCISVTSSLLRFSSSMVSPFCSRSAMCARWALVDLHVLRLVWVVLRQLPDRVFSSRTLEALIFASSSSASALTAPAVRASSALVRSAAATLPGCH